jgi:chloramphenicol O-acetyltransferase type A
MKKVDLQSWNRKEHYEFFSQFDEPFYGLNTEIDCTKAYLFCKETNNSFFAWYLHKSLLAVNGIEEFRLRIVDKQVVLFDGIHASTTIGREDGTFGVTFVPFSKDFETFRLSLNEEIAGVKNSTGMRLNAHAQRCDVIHYSSIPWVKFTGLTHPRRYGNDESEPKISFGKIYLKDGKWFMPVSVYVHHGLADGYHIAKYLDLFQGMMDDA